MACANPLLALYQERMATLAALGYAEGAPPPPLAVLFTALQVAPLRRIFSWAVPDDAALAAIASASPRGVVEVGAGTGYWAALLRHRGVDVAAFDAAPLDSELHNGHHALLGHDEPPPPFTRVQLGDAATAAAAHPGRTLLLCWPPPEERHASAPSSQPSMAVDALAAYAGERVVYIGDERGTTAGPAFHAALARSWALEARVDVPRWPSEHDSLTVWRRVGTSGTAAQQPQPQALDAAHGEPPGATAARTQLLARQDTAWADAAAAHVMARAAAGGPRAAPGPERAAVEAAMRAAPFVRRMLLRTLC